MIWRNGYCLTGVFKREGTISVGKCNVINEKTNHVGENVRIEEEIGDGLTDGGYTRIVHEYQLWMATFVEAVTSSYAPCGGVLGVGYEAIFDFGDFDFLRMY